MTNEERYVVQLDAEANPELAQDITRLQDKIGEALGVYHTLRGKHGELAG